MFEAVLPVTKKFEEVVNMEPFPELFGGVRPMQKEVTGMVVCDENFR